MAPSAAIHSLHPGPQAFGSPFATKKIIGCLCTNEVSDACGAAAAGTVALAKPHASKPVHESTKQQRKATIMRHFNLRSRPLYRVASSVSILYLTLPPPIPTGSVDESRLPAFVGSE